MQRLKRHATISWNTESRQIRILTLLPGEWSDPIRCRLAVASLDDNPQYETISYAWGDPNDTRAIEIENIPLEIPSSLESALRHLRKQDEPLTLWADAICIDQSHAQEKAHQVGIMGTIFSNCSSVYIWLGAPKDGEDSVDPFVLAEHFAENKHLYELPGFSVPEESQEPVFIDNGAFERLWVPFEGAMSHPWWSRLWCVQESILPPTGTVVRGHWRIPWEKLRVGAMNHSLEHSRCCHVANSLLPKKYVFNPDHLLEMSKSDHKDEEFVAAVSSLETVLRMFRHKECQDPRDRIFGLLGLLTLGHAPLDSLQPDYSLSARSVFVKAMKLCLAQSPNDIKYLLGSGFNSEQHDLPSWTRNFAAPLSSFAATVEQYRYRRYDTYDACFGKTPDVRLHDDDTLSLTGLLADQVEEVGAVVQTSVWRDPIWVWNALLEANRIAGTESLNQVSFQEARQEAFWRALTTDATIPVGGLWRRMNTSDHESLERALNSLVRMFENGVTTATLSDPEVDHVLNSIQAATYGRSFFRTKQGRFGLCYPTARPGDQVWILAGGNVPFILRPSNSDVGGATGPKTCLRLVGDCQCQGLMDGEGLGGGEAVMGEIFLV